MDVSGKWSIKDFEKIIEPVELFDRNLLSPDRKATLISVILDDTEEEAEIIEAVKALIGKENQGISLYQIGMPVVSKALAEYTEADFFLLPPLAVLSIALLLFVFFRSLRAVLIPLGSVFTALIWTFGLMAWLDTPLSMLTMIVPIFIIAVGTAYTMYIYSGYLDAARDAPTAGEAACLCMERLLFPTQLAVLTTTIGLGSLLLNHMSAIREFALFACFGIWALLILILFFLPAVFASLPLPRQKTLSPFFQRRVFDAVLQLVIRINLSYRRQALLVISLVAFLGFAGILQLRMETNPVSYFKESSPVSRHFHDIKEGLAGSFPVNVVLDSRTEDYFESAEHLLLIAKIQNFLDSLEGVDKTVSFADYLKLVSYASGRYEKEAYSLPEEDFEVRMLMNDFKSILGQELFNRFMSMDLSRVSICLRTHISSSRDFLRLKREISEFLGKTLPAPFAFQVTGLGIVISKSSDLLSKGQVKSLSITILLIFVIMFSLFMTRKVALITLLPNLFPVVVNFGVMGWLGIELSMATSLIASIAIGLAVDDTIHYMVQYNLEFKKDLDRERALAETIQRVGKPIILTTLTLGIGFSILTFSHFKPTAVFGLLMVITMFSALVGDLILLPTLMTRAELVTIWDLIRFKMGKDPRKGVFLFRGLSRLEIYFILMAGRLKSYRKGDVIFKRGDPGNSLYAVISGELQVVETLGDLEKFGSGVARKQLGTLKRGAILGELGLAYSHRRAATVVAAESSELLRINYDMIKRLYWIFPPTAQKFFFNLMANLSNKMEYFLKSFSAVTTVDSVTGLHNCEHFMPTLQKEVTRSHRYGLELSVGIIHLDLFREFSHAYGTGESGRCPGPGRKDPSWGNP